jgi:uncharacterized membrane protein
VAAATMVTGGTMPACAGMTKKKIEPPRHQDTKEVLFLVGSALLGVFVSWWFYFYPYC